MWFGPLGAIQKLFFHTPLVYGFIFGSSVYHDYLWWPFKGKAIQERTRRETVWGQLFEHYAIAEDAERFVPTPEGAACGPHEMPDHESGWRRD